MAPLIAEGVGPHGILQDVKDRSKRTVLYSHLADQSNPVAVIGVTNTMDRAQGLNRRAVGPMPPVYRNPALCPGQQVGDDNIFLVARHQLPR